MTDIQEKLSLLDALDNKRTGTFCIKNISELIINDIFIPIIDAYITVNVTDAYVQVNIFNIDKKIFFFEIENDKIYNFHIILK